MIVKTLDFIIIKIQHFVIRKSVLSKIERDWIKKAFKKEYKIGKSYNITNTLIKQV